MRAAIYREPYTPLDLTDWEKPVPEQDEILVEIAACGICHTDLRYIDHGISPVKSPPMILGHEVSGTVIEVGADTPDISPGARVLIPSVIPCRDCSYCNSGKTNLCSNRIMIGNQIDGGYAEYMTVPREGVIPIPDDLSFPEASILAGSYAVSHHALQNVGKLQPEETLLVFGSGGVGAAAIQIGHDIGAHVIALDMNPIKLRWAEEMGADETVNSHGIRDLGKHIRKMTGGGVDLALEAIGAPRTIYQTFTCLKPNGRAVILGYTGNHAKIPADQLVMSEREILGVFGCPLDEYPKIFERVQQDRYNPEKIVTDSLPLEEIEQGLNNVRSGQTLRTIIIPESQ